MTDNGKHQLSKLKLYYISINSGNIYNVLFVEKQFNILISQRLAAETYSCSTLLQVSETTQEQPNNVIAHLRFVIGYIFCYYQGRTLEAGFYKARRTHLQCSQ